MSEQGSGGIPPPASPPPHYAPTNGMAIASLVCGVLGVTTFPLIASILAVVFGGIAQREIAAAGGAMGGDSLARAGRILGWIGIGVAILGLVLVLIFLFAVGTVHDSHGVGGIVHSGISTLH